MKSRFASNGILSVLFSALVLLFTASLALAQENTGAVQGTIKDTAGASIPGAKVTLTGASLVRPLEVTTNKDGEYIFPKVPSGVYIVTVTQNGFKTVKNEDVNVVLGQAARVDVSLAAGAVTESVTISASSETLDVTSSKVATNITQQFFDNTPKGRNFHSLIFVAPGVRAETKAGTAGVGGFQINGASGSENTFIVDGVDVSNLRNGSLGRQDSIPFEFVNEVQVKTAGFEAEYTGTLGGVVNTTTRSGSDAFHGDGWLQFTGAAFNARPRGFWQINPADDTKGEFFRQKEDEYRTAYPGFTFSGPILKERLHFFAGYNAELTRTERTTTFITDGSTRTSTRRDLQHYGITRVDYAPTQKIQVSSSFFWNPARQTGSLFGTDGRVAPPSNDLSIVGGYVPAMNWTSSFIYTPTSKLTLEARYGYKYLNDKGGSYGKPGVPYLQYLRTAVNTDGTPVLAGIPTQFQRANNYTNVSSTFRVLKDVTTRNNLYLNASYLTTVFGQRHNFKGGYALNRLSNDVLDNYTNGYFRIYWNAAFTRGSIQNVKGTYGYYMWRDGIRHDAQVSSRNHGFYVQDSWQATKRLTLNLGLRLENEFLPPYTKVVGGKNVPNPISFGWGDKIAPLIGAAWDVKGDGKWKVSGSYGQYFDLMKYELARSSFGGDYWHDHIYQLNDPDLNKLSLANPAALAGGTAKIIDIDNRTVPINAQGQLDGIDPDIKPMSNRQYALGLEHEIKTGMVASVRWTRSRLVRGIEDIGYLDADENEVYTIGNPGFGLTDINIKSNQAPNGEPYVPRARRDYDGVEFRLDGRFSEGIAKRLGYSASYTWSRLFGNWSGLANSDENGRSDPNISRAFDSLQAVFDSKGKNVVGPLATDRPHTFKLFVNYEVPWSGKNSTTFAINQIAYSGTPFSSTVSVISDIPVLFAGRGDLGRSPVLTQTDSYLAHTIRLTESVKMRFDINVLNLFNQAAVTNVASAINRNGNITFADNNDFFKGFDVNSKLRPVTEKTLTPARSPIYALPTAYQGRRDVRLGVRFQF